MNVQGIAAIQDVAGVHLKSALFQPARKMPSPCGAFPDQRVRLLYRKQLVYGGRVRCVVVFPFPFARRVIACTHRFPDARGVPRPILHACASSSMNRMRPVGS